ncbi:MAG: hypothetical protein M3512_18300 [Bacteroidota bacterium]|nr:hypothetical protein [Bacteroidota bacterium]
MSKLSYTKVRKYLTEIYHDLILIEDTIAFRFPKVIYSFNISGHHDSFISFETQSLPVVPRVGENITIPYFKAHLHTDYFHVESIGHTFRDLEQTIDIWLKTGTYNLFWHFRKDQADEEGKFTLQERILLIVK